MERLISEQVLDRAEQSWHGCIEAIRNGDTVTGLVGARATVAWLIKQALAQDPTLARGIVEATTNKGG